MQRDVAVVLGRERERAARGGEEVARAGTARVGEPDDAAGRDEPGQEPQRRLDVRPRVEDVRGETTSNGPRSASASPCSVQLAWATSPTTSVSAMPCAANATASVIPSVASTDAPARAATMLGSARPQPSSSTRVPGAGGSAATAAASACPLGHRRAQ